MPQQFPGVLCVPGLVQEGHPICKTAMLQNPQLLLGGTVQPVQARINNGRKNGEKKTRRQ
jgi:hypothetical protein